MTRAAAGVKQCQRGKEGGRRRGSIWRGVEENINEAQVSARAPAVTVIGGREGERAVQLCSGSARGMDGWVRPGLMDSKRMYVMALVISGGGGAGWGSGVSCLPGVGAWGERRRETALGGTGGFKSYAYALLDSCFCSSFAAFFFEQYELCCLPGHVVR